MKFDEHPWLALWETTHACELACSRCGNSPKGDHEFQQLTTSEGMALLDTLAEAHIPRVVLSGADPSKRDDLPALVRHGAERELCIALEIVTTPLVSDSLLREFRSAKLATLGARLDAAEAFAHDAARGKPGEFSEAVRILRAARELDLRTQVNTTIHPTQVERLSPIAALVEELGAACWNVTYGMWSKTATLNETRAATPAVEQSLQELANIARAKSFAITTTQAPQYRRVLLEQAARRYSDGHKLPNAEPSGLNDGRGMFFVSYSGEVFPSGFLPINCGSVRHSNPVEIYRYHPVFRALRDISELTGTCAVCEYTAVCGGSRARAYASTGRLCASDPLCGHIPAHSGCELEHPLNSHPHRLTLVPSS